MSKQKGSVVVIILSLIIVASVAVLGGAMFINYRASQKTADVAIGEPVDSIDNTQTLSQDETQNIPADNPGESLSSDVAKETLSVAPKSVDSSVPTDEQLWAVFDNLVEVAKSGDIAKYVDLTNDRSVLSWEESQFKEYITWFYEENKDFVKSDFDIRWKDNKQAIFSTGPVKDLITDPNGDQYVERQIIFAKIDSSWEFLGSSYDSFGFSPSVSLSAQEKQKEVQDRFLDSDKDGVRDQEEVCGGSLQYKSSCVKTDPTKRDTDGDGWWDGVDKTISRFLSP
jgi:hypothetical protein